MSKKVNSTQGVLPAPYIVLYDSECRFCQAGVKRLKSLDKNHLTQPMPLSSMDILNMPQLSAAEVRRRMHVICPNGEMKIGFGAVIELARLFPATCLLARLAACPPVFFLGSALYDFLADHRYVFGSCDGDHCSLRKE